MVVNSNVRSLNLRDLEEIVQSKIARQESGYLENPMEYWTILTQIKQARALEHIANTLRDGVTVVVNE